MARNDEDWKRRRQREDEAELEEQLKKSAKETAELPPTSRESLPSEKLDQLISRTLPMIDQINNLYNMYSNGAERLPPLERRKQLDQNMLSLQALPKPTPATLFKYNAILSKYTTHKERWDKLMKDIESGKVKRKANAT